MASRDKINSTIDLLRSRELGSNWKNSSVFFGRQIQRLLIKSRAAQQSSPSAYADPIFESLETLDKSKTGGKPDGKKKKMPNSEGSKWTCFSATLNLKLSMQIIDDNFLLRIPLPEKTIYKIFRVFSSKSQRLRLQAQFQENEKKQWASYAIWYPSDDPSIQLEKGKIAKTLIVLHKPSVCQGLMKSQKICAYNLNDGKLLNAFPIVSDKTSYANLHVYHSENLLICSAAKSSLQKETVGEFLIFSAVPFTFNVHLQVKKCAVENNVTETEILGRLFTMSSKTSVEISSYDQMMATAIQNPDLMMKTNCATQCVKPAVTHILLEKPVVLWKINTMDAYLDLQENISPPLYFTKKKHIFKLNFLEEVEDKDQNLSVGEDNSVKFFPEEHFPFSPLTVLHGSTETGYGIYAAQPVGESHLLQKVFPKPIPVLQAAAPTSSAEHYNDNKRSVRRCKVSKSYVESEDESKLHGIDYEQELLLFATVTVTVSKNTVNVTLYDSTTMDVFAELQPIKILGRHRFSGYDCKQLIVDLQPTYLSILFELDTDKKRRIYILNFLDEPVVQQL